MNAGLSCAAMVPLAGSAATATKWGIKYGDEVVALSDDAVAKIDEAVGAACSFSGDTTVATPDGEKAISELEVGDTVLAWDEETGQLGSFEVTATFSHEDTVIEYLVIDGERLVTTPEHPFYTRERGWVAAGDLQKGEHVRKADGTYGVVRSLRLVEQKQRMYNLTVDEAHTYFVGDGGWLVHNMCAARALTPDELGHLDKINRTEKFLQEHPDIAREAKLQRQGVVLEDDHPGEARQWAAGLTASIGHLQRIRRYVTPEAQAQVDDAIARAQQYRQSIYDLLGEGS